MKLPKPRKLKSGNWFVRIMIDGERLSFTAPTKKECDAWLLTTKAHHADGHGIIHTENATVGSVMDAYIESRSNVLSPSTIRGYKMIRKNRWQSIITKHVSAIKNWQAVVNNESKACGAKTLKNAWGLLSSALKFVGFTVPPVRLPVIVDEEKSFLQPHEIQKLVAVVKGTDIEMEVLLALHSLRRSELYALRKKNIKDGMILVRGAVVPSENGIVYKETNKSKKSRRDVPIMIPRLQELADVITDEDELLCKTSFARSWVKIKKICKDNELPEMSLHGLRHSFASLCYHLGISEMETMALGGWSDVNVMRNIYTHLADEDKRQSERRLKDFFAS